MDSTKTLQNNFLMEYVSQLMQDAGLDKLPENFRNEYQLRLVIEVQRRIGIIVMAEMAPEIANEFLKMTERNAEQSEINDFLKANVPDHEEKTAKALEEFRREFLESARKLKSSVT